MGASIISLATRFLNQICQRLELEDAFALRLSCSLHTLALLSSLERENPATMCFQDALKSCLSSFSNLRMVGLKIYNSQPRHSPGRMIGIQDLQRQLGFNSVCPILSPGAAYEQATSFQTSVFQSHVFSQHTLTAALGTTHTRPETLETSSKMMRLHTQYATPCGLNSESSIEVQGLVT